MTIQTKFKITDEVYIPALKIHGRILAIYVGDSGVQYNIRWTWQGDIKTAYWFETEIEEGRSIKGGSIGLKPK